jgi:Na+/H+ antiporter NhaD/arsenite permease-like protein
MTARLVGLLGLLTLTALTWFLGVRDILAGRHRAGAGKVLSGLGLLVWVLLGALVLARDRFSTPVEWGALLAGSVLMLVGAMLGEKRRHNPKVNKSSDQVPGEG